MKADSLTFTTGEDLHNRGKSYAHISLFKGNLSLAEHKEILEWMNSKFPIEEIDANIKEVGAVSK